MKTHNVKPGEDEFRYCSEDEKFIEYDLEELEKLELDEIWYWYATGCCVGDGAILMRKGDLYCVDSLSHCSCYGPTDSLSFDGMKIGDLKKKHSEGLLKEASILIKKAFGDKGELK